MAARSLAVTAEGAGAGRPLDGLRRATERWVLRERSRRRLSSGLPALDGVLSGGWPQGRISEMVGPASSGRTGIAVATVAAATRRGEVAAWIDAADAFDPGTAREAGVALDRVLWVRPHSPTQAVRAAELVLEAGGFSVVVVDLTRSGAEAPAAPRSGRRERRSTLRVRLARAAERAGAVVLVLSGYPWAGTLAGVTVVLGRGTAGWGRRERGAPAWLSGLAAQARVERGGVVETGRTVTVPLSHHGETVPVVEAPPLRWGAQAGA